jgi:hypothetical protein
MLLLVPHYFLLANSIGIIPVIQKMCTFGMLSGLLQLLMAQNYFTVVEMSGGGENPNMGKVGLLPSETQSSCRDDVTPI